MTNKNMRRGMGSLLATAMASLALVSLPASHASAAEPTDSPASYIAWLQAQGSTASATLSAYQALPADKQEAFLGYIESPEIHAQFADFVSSDPQAGPEGQVLHPQWDPNTSAISTAPGDAPANPFPVGVDVAASATGTSVETKTIDNGNVQMEAVRGTTNVLGTSVTPTAGKAGDWHAWYKVSDKIFGIKVTEVKIWVDYRTNTTRVTKVYLANGSHRNFVPGSGFSKGPAKKWISAAGNAHGQIVWDATFLGHEWSAVQHIWANEYGYQGGSLK
ncbi:hypothetical protein ACFCXC_35840 [Streptomyces microflavus]|uniref:Uncharacterized protein n=1 Tax=Streptomyces microflavus TaxID=1919 RepID=A0A7H8N104_STRMI|nr:hypothetical protein [Streptomyces microflavus]QKW48157.1 hypothetical protein HUT09_37125 [Streptomyces microflavus]